MAAQAAHAGCSRWLLRTHWRRAGAGTDANVTCVLFGQKGQTPATQLESSRNDFERGQRDDFVIESTDLGPITKLQIGHDNRCVMVLRGGACWP